MRLFHSLLALAATGLVPAVFGRLQLLLPIDAKKTPSISQFDFPDPAVIQDIDGTWYAFGTTSNGKNVQVAKAPAPDGTWTYLDIDALPDPGNWTSGINTWAPDVRVLEGAKLGYVMYYSGDLAGDNGFHCIGAATSMNITGPYEPQDGPFACPTDEGGAIDPSGYYDEPTQRRYVAYKVDGNSIGHGGNCNNGISPLEPTPILLQEVEKDGVTPIGNPVDIFDRGEDDGPLVEAPNIIRTDQGLYILFFSSDCYDGPNYTVKYATSGNLTGPYNRTKGALLESGAFGLTSPGGATSIVGGGTMVFHADCEVGRCLYANDFFVHDTHVYLR